MAPACGPTICGRKAEPSGRPAKFPSREMDRPAPANGGSPRANHVRRKRRIEREGREIPQGGPLPAGDARAGREASRGKAAAGERAERTRMYVSTASRKTRGSQGAAPAIPAAAVGQALQAAEKVRFPGSAGRWPAGRQPAHLRFAPVLRPVRGVFRPGGGLAARAPNLSWSASRCRLLFSAACKACPTAAAGSPGAAPRGPRVRRFAVLTYSRVRSPRSLAAALSGSGPSRSVPRFFLGGGPAGCRQR